MSYSGKKVSESTTIELLAEILKREKPGNGPYKISFGEIPLESIVGIGNDNTARIIIFKDDRQALMDITGIADGI